MFLNVKAEYTSGRRDDFAPDETATSATYRYAVTG
jgi:hypothetical protein